MLLILVFVLTLPGVTRRIYASDEIQYFSFLRSLWFDGDVSFDNEYRFFYDSGITRYDGFRDTFLEARTETGRRLNFGTIGCAILWSPFYAIADLGVMAARAFGSTVPQNGFSPPYIGAVCIGSAVYGLLALLLSAAAARRVLSLLGHNLSAAWGAAWAVWLGTPLLFYMYVAPPMAHATSAFAVSAFVLAWLAVRDTWSPRGMILLGALGALVAMVREQDAFFLLGPALDFAWSMARVGRRRRLLLSAVAGSVAFVLTFLPQAAVYLSLNGHLGPSPLVSRKMTWTAPHLLDVLISTEHGFLWWTPICCLAVLGWILAVTGSTRLPSTPDHRPATLRLGICLLIMAAFQVYVAGSVESWTVAGAFGQRRFVAMTPLLVIGLAVLLARTRAGAPRWILALSVVAGIWWNIGLMIQFGAGWMDRQRLDVPRNAYNTFVIVPRRIPDIAYRYLFERHSFFQKAPPPGG
ncbi:MAG: hypothetical protein AABY89_06035, partial [Acidobacteriota bacterium]